jgi:hypothetical protein
MTPSTPRTDLPRTQGRPRESPVTGRVTWVSRDLNSASCFIIYLFAPAAFRYRAAIDVIK